jgi:hypothetical protein
MEQLAAPLAAARAPTLPPPSQKPSFPAIAIGRTQPLVPVAPRRRGAMLAAGSAAVLLAGALGLLAARRGPPELQAARPPHAAVAVAAPEPAPRPAPVVTPEPAPEPEPAPLAPPPVTLEIASRPSGAEVFRALDGIKVGTTPLSLELPPSAGRAVFVLRLAGYRDQRVELAADGDSSADVVLHKVRSRPPRRPATRDGALDPFAP